MRENSKIKTKFIKDVSYLTMEYPRVHLRNPPVFSGKPDEDPINWLKRFSLTKKNQGLSDETAIQLAGSYMDGLAATWYFQQESSFEDWKTFQQLFEAMFVSTSKREYWWDQLHMKKQKGHETVDEVAAEILELVNRLNITDEEMRVRYYLKALKPEIAEQVSRRQPKRWNVALDAARLEQSIQSTFRKNLGTDIRTPLFPETSEPNTDLRHDIKQLTEEFKKITVHLVKQNTNMGTKPPDRRPPRPFKCYDCGQDGHKKWDCPKRNQNEELGKGQGYQ